MSEVPPGVDLARLQPWFAAHVDGATGGPLHASLISGGRSNLTYSVGDDAHEWVLRRPPLGHVLPTAHDMAREYTVLTALAGTDVPVPRTLASCALRSRRRPRRRSCTATTGSTTRCSPPTIPVASSPCSIGRWRHSAIHSPTSGCSSCTGAVTRPLSRAPTCRRPATRGSSL